MDALLTTCKYTSIHPADHGMPQDECTDPKGPKDQGVFASQKDQYLRGKFIRITPEALLKNQKLVKGTHVPIPAG